MAVMAGASYLSSSSTSKMVSLPLLSCSHGSYRPLVLSCCTSRPSTTRNDALLLRTTPKAEAQGQAAGRRISCLNATSPDAGHTNWTVPCSQPVTGGTTAKASSPLPPGVSAADLILENQTLQEAEVRDHLIMITNDCMKQKSAII